jgi:hypothetical protein
MYRYVYMCTEVYTLLAIRLVQRSYDLGLDACSDTWYDLVANLVIS